jgi:hypothetical protein
MRISRRLMGCLRGKMPDAVKENGVRKLEEEKKKKEEELKRIMREIEEKSNQIKKERNEEMEEMLKEIELPSQEERSMEDIVGSTTTEEEEVAVEDELEAATYKAQEEYSSGNEEDSYNTSLNTMQDVYDTVKSLYSASENQDISANELNAIRDLEEKLTTAQNAYIPSEQAVKLLHTSKSMLEKIRRYNL